MKKLLISSIMLLFLLVATNADSFTDILQDLAIQTACIGQYSATQAGGGWYDDPQDYYTPAMMAERFKNMSGNMTRTTTFYGVCFDYAEFAYWDIQGLRIIYFYRLFQGILRVYHKAFVFLKLTDSLPL